MTPQHNEELKAFRLAYNACELLDDKQVLRVLAAVKALRGLEAGPVKQMWDKRKQ